MLFGGENAVARLQNIVTRIEIGITSKLLGCNPCTLHTSPLYAEQARNSAVKRVIGLKARTLLIRLSGFNTMCSAFRVDARMLAR